MRNPAANLPAEREALARSLTQGDAPARRAQQKPSRRAQRLWDRLGDWYGVRFADQFGDTPPPDWCSLIDRVSNDDLVSALIVVRQQHVTFPPTLPEFASILREVRRPAQRGGASPAEQLTAFVVTNRHLTPAQMRGWCFLYREAEDGSRVTTGLIIPADGDSPGCRVMVEDMQVAS